MKLPIVVSAPGVRVALVALCFLSGCAEGATVDDVAGDGGAYAAPGDGGDDASGDSGGTGGGGGVSDADSPFHPIDASPTPPVDDASAVDAAEDSAEVVPDGGAPDTGGGGSVVSCTAPDPCSSATTLVSVDGDDTSPADVVQGTGSQWFVVEVVDTDSWNLTDQELVHITLQSPPGVEFDLYAYQSTSTSSATCSGGWAGQDANGIGGLATVELSWDDEIIVDNSELISIYVSAAAATVCETGQTWTLTVTGNE